jgi:hypothetical protein
MAVTQWTLTDNSTGTPVVWTFPMNPIEFQHPGRKANFSTEATVSSIGSTILFQGRDEVPTLSFTGTITSSTFYDELREQLDKFYDLILTDDQSNSWTIIVESYSMDRKKSALNHHRYSYNVTAKVLA